MIKYLIVVPTLREAILEARELNIDNSNEWRFIPSDKSFMDKARGYYQYVKHGDIHVVGYLSNKSFLARYEKGF